MKRATRKPLLAAILALILGPIGFVYVQWRIAVTTAIGLCCLVLYATTLSNDIPNNWYLINGLTLAYQAYVVTRIRNILYCSQDKYANKLNTWSAAVLVGVRCLAALIAINMVLLTLTSAYHALDADNFLRAIILSFLSLAAIPIYLFIVYFVVGLVNAKGENVLIHSANSLRLRSRRAFMRFYADSPEIHSIADSPEGEVVYALHTYFENLVKEVESFLPFIPKSLSMRKFWGNKLDKAISISAALQHAISVTALNPILNGESLSSIKLRRAILIDVYGISEDSAELLVSD